MAKVLDPFNTVIVHHGYRTIWFHLEDFESLSSRQIVGIVRTADRSYELQEAGK